MEFPQIEQKYIEQSKTVEVVDAQAAKPTTANNVLSLLDLCTKVAGKYCNCDDMEKHNPPIDEELLKKIAVSAFPHDVKEFKARTCIASYSVNEPYCKIDSTYNWQLAEMIIDEDRVCNVCQIGFMVTAIIKTTQHSDESVLDRSENDINVSLTFEKQLITSTYCSNCALKSGFICSHIIATVLYRMSKPNEVTFHAPVTEVLSSLNRDQLQKLLQHAISDDPTTTVLGKVFKYVDVLRDSKSKLNQETSVPDPTIGPEDPSSQWKHTKELFEKKVSDFVKILPTQRYVNNSITLRFLDDVTSLQKCGSYQHAAELLIIFLNKVYGLIDRGLKELVCGSTQFIDAFRVLKWFMLDPGIDTTAFETLRTFVNSLPRFKVPKCDESHWNGLPHLSICFPKIKKKHEYSLYVADVVCTQSIVPWPPQLMAVLNKEKDWKESTYDEDIVIMLNRLEALFHTSDNTNYHKVVIYLQIVLRKLARYALKHSILSLTPETTLQQMFDIHNLSGEDLILTNKIGYIPSNRRAKRRKTCRKPQSLNMSTEEEVYGLMYCLGLQEQMERLSEVQLMPDHVTMAYCLLAVELSRFWLFNAEISQEESECLLNYQLILKEMLKKKLKDKKVVPNVLNVMCGKLADVTDSHLHDFYGDCPPLLLHSFQGWLIGQGERVVPIWRILIYSLNVFLKVKSWNSLRLKNNCETHLSELFYVLLSSCQVQDQFHSVEKILVQVVPLILNSDDYLFLKKMFHTMIKGAGQLFQYHMILEHLLRFFLKMLAIFRRHDCSMVSNVWDPLKIAVSRYGLPSVYVLVAMKADLKSREILRILKELKEVLKVAFHLKDESAKNAVDELVLFCFERSDKEDDFHWQSEDYISVIKEITYMYNIGMYLNLMESVANNVYDVDHTSLFHLALAHFRGKFKADSIFWSLIESSLVAMNKCVKCTTIWQPIDLQLVQWFYGCYDNSFGYSHSRRVKNNMLKKFLKIVITKCDRLPQVIEFIAKSNNELPPCAFVRSLPHLGDTLMNVYMNCLKDSKVGVDEIRWWQEKLIDLFGEGFVSKFNTKLRPSSDQVFNHLNSVDRMELDSYLMN